MVGSSGSGGKVTCEVEATLEAARVLGRRALASTRHMGR